MGETTGYNLLVILGATATGKTATGVRVARTLKGEIISADSRQVFRGMDLGTGKDLAEYGAVPYHLIDICEAGDEFSLFAFQQRFHQALERIQQRGCLPILVGGTGLYLDCAIRNYRLLEVPPDPQLRRQLDRLGLEGLRAELRRYRSELHNGTDLEDRARLVRAIEIARAELLVGGERPQLPVIAPLVFGISWERRTLRERIARRLRERIAQGMLEEVESLHSAGVSWERLEEYGLEYRYVGRFLRREISRNDLLQQLAAAIGQFAKRQETFFRRMERQGVEIHWLAGCDDPATELLTGLADRGLVSRGGRLVTETSNS